LLKNAVETSRVEGGKIGSKEGERLESIRAKGARSLREGLLPEVRGEERESQSKEKNLNPFSHRGKDKRHLGERSTGRGVNSSSTDGNEGEVMGEGGKDVTEQEKNLRRGGRDEKSACRSASAQGSMGHDFGRNREEGGVHGAHVD